MSEKGKTSSYFDVVAASQGLVYTGQRSACNWYSESPLWPLACILAIHLLSVLFMEGLCYGAIESLPIVQNAGPPLFR